MRQASATLLALAAVLSGALVLASTPPPAAPAVAGPAVSAATTTTEDPTSFTLAEAPLDLAVVGAVALAGGTCEDFGMFGADKRKECNASCKHGRVCVKKEKCGEGSCPDPGYCWKCAN